MGRFAEAADTLIAAADKGDAEAVFMLAGWRISGQVIARDTTAARELMGAAAQAGHPTGSHYYAHFLANGTGGPADWKKARAVVDKIAATQPAAAEQLAMLERMAVDENGEPTRVAEPQMVSRVPLVYSASAFLTDDECDYLVRAAEPRLQPSVVIERATGRSLPHPDRRSDGAFFGVGHEDLVVNAINRRIAAVSGTRTEQAEPLQILRYGPGGEFRPHYDFVKEGGNQRILTALVYLTEGYEGGETRFVRTGLDFRGRKGDLLILHNVTTEGRPDLSSEHAGLPVRSGTKVVASRWIWREPYLVAPPRPIVSGI
jgi:prolyl 4-hydroxylase